MMFRSPVAPRQDDDHRLPPPDAEAAPDAPAFLATGAPAVEAPPASAAEPLPAPEPLAAPPPAALIVQFAEGTAPADIAALLAAVGARETVTLREAEPGAGPLLTLTPDPALALDDAIALLSQDAAVAFAEPDFQVSAQLASNDPRFVDGSLWGMHGDGTALRNAFGSQAGEAWIAGQVGSAKTVVGIVDSGVDYRHVDLYQNVWLNQREIPIAFRGKLTDVDRDGLITFRDLNNSLNGTFVSDINRNGRIDAGDLLNDTRWENGIDEDGNGYRDDLVGWDFVNNDNDPFDDNGHGTHVAGTIGAQGGNGTGVAGVAWNVQMVALKFLGASGSGAISNAIRALDYFTGAATRAAPAENFVGTNNSWGGGGASTALGDAIARAAKQDLLFIAAAGNGGSDGNGDNNDLAPNWPSNYDTRAAAGFDSVISVAALTSTGARAAYSNYGAVSVDLGAPGSGILSTLPGDSYGVYSGTSMAAPHVTGAAALYAAAHPTATAAQIKAAILNSAAATGSMAGITSTGDRLDIGTLMNTTAPVAPSKTATIARAIDDFGPVTGTIAIGASTDDRTPTLAGALSATLGAGETVAILRNGVKVGDAVVSGTSWSFTEATALGAGAVSYAARVDKSGVAGSVSSSYGFTVVLGPNGVTGTAGNDVLTGTSGADIISGVPTGATILGRGTIDKMTGGAGNDIFVLGDSRGAFYDDGDALRSGAADYGQILDFQAGDKIQLARAVGSYFLSAASVGGVGGLGIYADLNRNGRFDAADELIGHVAKVAALSSADFVFA